MTLPALVSPAIAQACACGQPLAQGQPWIASYDWRIATTVLGYIFAMGLSGRFVNLFLAKSVAESPAEPPIADAPATPPKAQPQLDVHAVIGKCENVIALTLILAGQVTGLALILGAKSIVRAREGQLGDYYLAGTMLNLAWSVAVGTLLRYAVVGPLP